MMTLIQSKALRSSLAGFLVAFLAQTTTGHAEECSLTKTNNTCTLTIDRRSPLVPPTIQMYPKAVLTVEVKNPYYFERYFMDYQSGQLALVPDVAATIVGGLLPSLQKASVIHGFAMIIKLPPGKTEEACTVENIKKRTPTNGGEILSVDSFYTGCFTEFTASAKDIYRRLEPAVAPDSHPRGSGEESPSNDTFNTNLTQISEEITTLYTKQIQLSSSIAIAAKLDKTDGTSALTPEQGTTVRELAAMSALADPVAKDLFAYASRIADLSKGLPEGQTLCSTQSGEAKNADVGKEMCVKLFPIKDPPVAKAKMVTRQVTYAINALNLVQNSQVTVADPTKKKVVANINLLYGNSHWETSSGAFFSTLAVRSFSVAPVITGTTVTDKRIAQNILHPTIVPFVAANYRILDLGWSNWRSAVYWSAVVGVNPNTVSADFATGPSISFRTLMFSALWHYGHDVRLTQGLYAGQTLGASFNGSATTETYWRSAFAVGVSIRIPSLTGR